MKIVVTVNMSCGWYAAKWRSRTVGTLIAVFVLQCLVQSFSLEPPVAVD